MEIEFLFDPTLVEQQPCPSCRMHMMLARIQQNRPDHDMHVFRCSTCQRSESAAVKYK
jgi:hypothetical protein